MKATQLESEKYFLLDVRNGPIHVRSVTIKDTNVIPELELANRLEEIPKDKEIIVYCWDVWCNTAAKAAKFLLEQGYQVKELIGGLAAWQEMNFPVSEQLKSTDVAKNCGC
ncbi:rhodanese-like domain-containing protein [Sporosarcina sp. Te-1]|uniref:rhodanese-like domain-containing protein n=1 Tax=Sporosarcina sp. Te-1 TaxID=2818390 RepID=UPI001FB0BC9E|nr:rhodanese-like domain-containing protein [Sporosarcina sp. Te-1]